jgi:hypothetical protein
VLAELWEKLGRWALPSGSGCSGLRFHSVRVNPDCSAPCTSLTRNEQQLSAVRQFSSCHGVKVRIGLTASAAAFALRKTPP